MVAPASFSTSAAARPAAASSGSAAGAAAAPAAAAASGNFSSIPVIDLSGTFESAGVSPAELQTRRRAVAAEIDAACRNVGFFTITGHGVGEEEMARMWSVTQAYFDRPVEEKNAIVMDKEYPYGYSGFGGESLAKGYDTGAATRPDPKESFCIGPYDARAGMPEVRWPQHPADFQKDWLAYYQHMEKLAAHLLSLAALALDLPPTYFEDKIDRHRSALRALNYPKLDVALAAGEVRAGAHTDYGSLTILWQDSTGGLQVRNRARQWVDATPRPNSFVINLGDLMARWTNDKWVSTLHRVVQPPQAAALPPARRQSIAFFHNVNADAVVSALPTCTDAANPPKYPPIQAWDFLLQKHQASTGY
jgi:isopenicillin N synthase-like dioxygenase